MAKPQKSTAQSEVPGLVKKGPLYYLKRDWQLYALMLLPMVFIIVFKYFAYTGLSVAFLDYKIGKGYAGSKFVGLKIFEKVFKHRDFTKAVVNTLLLNVLDLIFSFPMPIILALLLNEICLYQFGHNDQKLAHLQAYGGYTDRLRTYIKEARTAGAVPVLVTPLARNSWKDAAHYNDFLADFADAVLTLGKAENVMVLDLHTWAMALMQQDGLETAKRWFYPGDYTHTNDFGAYKMAGFVAHALGDALGLMVTDAPEWTPTPPFVPLEAPADCAIPAPEGDPFADYDATRPNDTLTRAEALELAIKALKLFPINVYNDLYSDIVGHETYAGTIQCAAQNDLIPPEWVADGSLYPNQTVTAADFLAVLIPGAAGRRPLADAVPVPDSVPVYARQAVGQAVAEGLIAPEALTKPLNRSNAAEICRRLHI